MARSCNRENMLKLVEALESGEYTQAQSALRVGDNFCCLGVASDLAAKAGIGHWELDGAWYFVDNAGSDPFGHHMESSVLTAGVMDWLGVDISQVALDGGKTKTSSASGLNDNGGTFADIAAKLREEYGLGDAR